VPRGGVVTASSEETTGRKETNHNPTHSPRLEPSKYDVYGRNGWPACVSGGKWVGPSTKASAIRWTTQPVQYHVRTIARTFCIPFPMNPDGSQVPDGQGAAGWIFPCGEACVRVQWTWTWSSRRQCPLPVPPPHNAWVWVWVHVCVREFTRAPFTRTWMTVVLQPPTDIQIPFARKQEGSLDSTAAGFSSERFCDNVGRAVAPVQVARVSHTQHTHTHTHTRTQAPFVDTRASRHLGHRKTFAPSADLKFGLIAGARTSLRLGRNINNNPPTTLVRSKATSARSGAREATHLHHPQI
jgi:hypothetical protein